MNTTFIIYAVNIALTLFVVGGLVWIDYLKDFV
jgi:hypothetical protein|nr:MAG TPA: hypothetical protein [Caudoviricetes sp.]